MRFLPPVLAIGALLAACSSETVPQTFDPQAKADEQAAKERAADARAIRSGFAPPAPAPLQTVSVDPPKAPAPGVILPPADRQYRYIGRWAANAQMCETGAWRFKVRELTTAGETSCDLPTVAAVRNSYRLEGVCRAEGKKTDDILKLSFDEPAKRMLVEGRTLGPVSLLYCGD